MMTIKTIPGSATMWRNRLCCECQFFIRTPFSVGKCSRRDASYPPSIVDERAYGCGPNGKFYMAKRAAA